MWAFGVAAAAAAVPAPAPAQQPAQAQAAAAALRPRISDAIRRLEEVAAARQEAAADDVDDSQPPSSTSGGIERVCLFLSVEELASPTPAVEAAGHRGRGEDDDGGPPTEPAPLNGAELDGLGRAIEIAMRRSAVSTSFLVDQLDLSGSLNGSPASSTSMLLRRVLGGMSTLTLLNLSSCNLQIDQVRVVAELARFSPCLRELYLGFNDLGDDGVQALVAGGIFLGLPASADDEDIAPSGGGSAEEKMPPASSALEELYLNSNKIGPKGARELGRALKASSSMTSLRVLELSSNCIGDVGVKALSNSLCRNNSLEELWLNRNRLGNPGCLALSKMLHQNSALTRLYLLQNHKISFVGVTALEMALLHANFTLEELKVDRKTLACCSVSSSHNGNYRISHLCSRNLSLKQFCARLKCAGVFDDVLHNTGLWPHILERLAVKPDLLYAALRDNPQMFAGPPPPSNIASATALIRVSPRRRNWLRHPRGGRNVPNNRQAREKTSEKTTLPFVGKVMQPVVVAVGNSCRRKQQQEATPMGDDADTAILITETNKGFESQLITSSG